MEFHHLREWRLEPSKNFLDLDSGINIEYGENNQNPKTTNFPSNSKNEELKK